MSEEENEAALDALLDSTLDDIADLPEFKPYPPGVHKVFATLEAKVVNEHPTVELTLKGIGSIELDNNDHIPIAEGDESSMLFMLDNEFGAGKLKPIAAVFGAHLNTGNLKEIVAGTKDIEVTVATKLRKNKEDPDKPYMDVKELVIN